MQSHPNRGARGRAPSPCEGARPRARGETARLGRAGPSLSRLLRGLTQVLSPPHLLCLRAPLRAQHCQPICLAPHRPVGQVAVRPAQRAPSHPGSTQCSDSHRPTLLTPVSLSSLPGDTESSPRVPVVPGLLRLDRLPPGFSGSQEGDPVGIDEHLGRRAESPVPEGLP